MKYLLYENLNQKSDQIKLIVKIRDNGATKTKF